MIIGFFIVLSTAITLLVVNVFSKNTFKTDLNSLQAEKQCRNNFSSAKLTAIIVYTAAFLPSWVNPANFNISAIAASDIKDYY